jgi:hypothetical protein
MPSIMRNVEGSPQLWIFKQIENVVKQRLNSKNKRINLLQLMLDASTEQEIQIRSIIELIKKINIFILGWWKWWIGWRKSPV